MHTYVWQAVLIANFVYSVNAADTVEANAPSVTTEYDDVNATTDPVISEWVGRKIGASHIFNDVNFVRDALTENEEEEEETEEKAEVHPCNRPCIENEPPMICHYQFKVEWYQTMSKACYDCPYNRTDCRKMHCIAGDGVKRPILVVNRQFPGPAIEICVNDTVVAEVENALLEEGTSVHWHGQHQRHSPHMDGVPFVTQCPIYPRSTFTYRFVADIPGTHFWHSHSALQRGDGMFGALIVRVPKTKDPHQEFFDFDLSEHVMIIMDWCHSVGINKFIAHHHSDGDNKPESILINGKGRYVEFEDELGTIYTTPLERFDVMQGYRYRFRIINAGFLNCPIELSIDNHTMVVVSSDGNDLEPEEADSLVLYAGERFDIIVQMDQEVSNYWIRYRGLMDCDERFTSAFQLAILSYNGTRKKLSPSGEKPTYDNSGREGLQINSLNTGFQWNGSLSVPEMKSVASQSDPRLQLEADFKFYVAYDFYSLDNPLMHLREFYGFHQIQRKREQIYTPQLNHITMKLPPFPLLVELDRADKLEYCNDSSVTKDCETTFCECTHMLQVPLNSVIELILVDKGFTYNANHPFHLHGHSFRVVGMDRLGENVTVNEIKKLDFEGKLHRNFHFPPIKDTITVPDGGYTVLRWQATNPGYWLFHCHIDYHLELGMGIVFKVGDRKDFVPTPIDFPRCNNYSPDAHQHRVIANNTEKETSIRYKNYDKNTIAEIEFDIDNTLKFLGQSKGSTFFNDFNTIFLLLTVFMNL